MNGNAIKEALKPRRRLACPPQPEAADFTRFL